MGGTYLQSAKHENICVRALTLETQPCLHLFDRQRYWHVAFENAIVISCKKLRQQKTLSHLAPRQPNRVDHGFVDVVTTQLERKFVTAAAYP